MNGVLDEKLISDKELINEITLLGDVAMGLGTGIFRLTSRRGRLLKQTGDNTGKAISAILAKYIDMKRELEKIEGDKLPCL